MLSICGIVVVGVEAFLCSVVASTGLLPHIGVGDEEEAV
jgi:hypothetical protein